MSLQTPTSEIHAENYRFLQRQVYSRSGIVVEENKHYLFECRLTPIVRQMGLSSINDLCALMAASPNAEVGHRVAEAMTTNETYFFRDPAHYDLIRTVLLPALKQERLDTRRMRFWSAAASTGQEAYSLAMLLLQEALDDWRLDILGTDFSTPVVERARAARYQQIEVNRGLPTPLLLKHFRRAGLEWQLNEQVRKMVRFERIDLRDRMSALGPFDLVFCRNVLIYFDLAVRRKIVREIHGTLFRGGWLLLGSAETHAGMDEWFERRTIGGAVVYVAR